MTRVLVAIPYATTLPVVLQERMQANAARLVSANPTLQLEVVLVANTLRPLQTAPPCWEQATARNQVLDEYLTSAHDLVLWIDSDVVAYPPDLPTQLLSAQAQPAIVAPLNVIEATDTLYDSMGFRELDGRKPRVTPPYFQTPGTLVPLAAVGTCYLAPAALYAGGLRYTTTEGQTEHWSVMQAALARGWGVWCVPAVCVQHAALPRYGIAWHVPVPVRGAV